MEVAQLNDDVLSKMELDTKLSSIKKINENVSIMEASDETDEISQKEYPNPNSLKREEIKEIHEEMVDVGEESLEMSNEKNKSDLIKEGKVEATASEISKDESQPSHHIETDDADERNNEKAIGIGSSKQRNLLNKKTINRKRKQKDSEISDDVEDDEFIPESKRFFFLFFSNERTLIFLSIFFILLQFLIITISISDYYNLLQFLISG